MEKENNIITLIHKDVLGKYKVEKEPFVYSCIDEKMITFLLNTSRQEHVFIVDKTHNKQSDQRVFFVQNHVNKTGENPIRGRQSLSIKPFFDITEAYCKHEGAVTTTSCGKKYLTMKDKEKYPSTYLSNITILCKAIGFNKITGVLVNN